MNRSIRRIQLDGGKSHLTVRNILLAFVLLIAGTGTAVGLTACNGGSNSARPPTSANLPTPTSEALPTSTAAVSPTPRETAFPTTPVPAPRVVPAPTLTHIPATPPQPPTDPTPSSSPIPFPEPTPGPPSEPSTSPTPSPDPTETNAPEPPTPELTATYTAVPPTESPPTLTQESEPTATEMPPTPSLDNLVKLNCEVCTLEEYETILNGMKKAYPHNLYVFGEDTFDEPPTDYFNITGDDARRFVDAILRGWTRAGVWEHEGAHALQANLFHTSELWYDEGLANYSQTIYGAFTSPVGEGSIYEKCIGNPNMADEYGRVRYNCNTAVAEGLNILEMIENNVSLNDIYVGMAEGYVLAQAHPTGNLFFMLLEKNGLTLEKNQEALKLLKQVYKSKTPNPIDVDDIRRAYEEVLDINLDDIIHYIGPGIRNNSHNLTKLIEELLNE